MGIFSNIDSLSSRLFYTDNGQIFISALFGIALALIFQKVCKDKKCIVISAPATEEVTQFEGECFKYKPYGISCPEDEKNVVKGV
jgi:hypothetical protein